MEKFPLKLGVGCFCKINGRNSPGLRCSKATELRGSNVRGYGVTVFQSYGVSRFQCYGVTGFRSFRVPVIRCSEPTAFKQLRSPAAPILFSGVNRRQWREPPLLQAAFRSILRCRTPHSSSPFSSSRQKPLLVKRVDSPTLSNLTERFLCTFNITVGPTNEHLDQPLDLAAASPGESPPS